MYNSYRFLGSSSFLSTNQCLPRFSMSLSLSRWHTQSMIYTRSYWRICKTSFINVYHSNTVRAALQYFFVINYMFLLFVGQELKWLRNCCLTPKWENFRLYHIYKMSGEVNDCCLQVSPVLITFSWDSAFLTKNNKEYTSGTRDILVGIRPNFILLESLKWAIYQLYHGENKIHYMRGWLNGLLHSRRTKYITWEDDWTVYCTQGEHTNQYTTRENQTNFLNLNLDKRSNCV